MGEASPNQVRYSLESHDLGTFSPADDDTYYSCEYGKFQDTVNNSEWIISPAGYFVNTYGSTNPERWTNITGEYSLTGESECSSWEGSQYTTE